MSLEFSIDGIIAELNREQREAVQFLGGPLAIIAGAGTGKTRVITYRIAYLIAAGIAKPEEILALTFTDKAALEMEERVDVLMPYGRTGYTIQTFHSFGDRIIREFAVDLGLTPEAKLLSQAEQALFLRKHLFDLPLNHYRPLSNPTKFLQALLSHFSRLKDEDIQPGEYLAFAENMLASARQDDGGASKREAEKQLELANCYRAYQQMMAENGLMDFGDQIALVLGMLRDHPDIRQRLQQRFRHILVDEFQDTNYAQFQLVKELADEHRNLTVVADDDQSIYKFRGAAISNILNFAKVYPDAHHVVLTRNYRSTQTILDAAYRLIRNNDPDRLEVKQDIDKKLQAHAPGGKLVEHWHHDTLSAEAEAIANEISQRTSSGENRLSDFCLLVRSNNSADPYLNALTGAGIPFRFSGNRGLYQLPEIRLLLAFMRAIANPYESQSLYALCQSEIYEVPMSDLQMCLAKSFAEDRPLAGVFKALDQLEFPEAISMEAQATIQKLLQDIDKFQDAARDQPTYQILYSFMKETGYLNRLVEKDRPEDDRKISNIAKFMTTVQSYEHFTEPGDLAFFVNNLDLLRELGDDPGTAEAEVDIEAVPVMTIHKSKGLEFPVVFLVGLVDKKFPTIARRSTIELPDGIIKDELPEGDFHLQEERRLFYVGMTRAQQELYLTSARDHGGSRPRKVSRFVHEAVETAHRDDDFKPASPVEKIRRFDKDRHPKLEHEAPLPDDELIRLNPYQVDDYLTCPLKYKYIHILRVPLEDHHSINYGYALHEAIRTYHQRKIKREQVSVEDLLTAFRTNWRRKGYLDQKHRQLRQERGEAILRNFFEQQEREGTIPTHIERPFRFRFDNIELKGRWDRIDEFADGRVVITDFKSSEVDDAEKARKRTVESKQLRIYAWAYEEEFGHEVHSWRLHFVDSGLIGETVRKESFMTKIRQDVQKVAEGIRQRDFHPKPGPGTCPYCPYTDICPAAEPN